MSDPGLRAELATVGDLESLADEWRALEESAEGSFFQSWHWMGTWLHSLPQGIVPHIVRVVGTDRVVGLAALVFGARRRRRLIHTYAAHLNETGDARLDNLTVEHNGVLAKADLRLPAQRAVTQLLLRHQPEWDEFHIGGADDLWEAMGAGEQAPLHFRVVREKTCYSVEGLDRLPAGVDGYLGELSANTRYQIRRAMRRYEQSEGALGLAVARDREEAQLFLTSLRELHQEYWIARGEPGCFADPFFERFHRSLIDRSFSSGAIQLVRVTAGSAVVGYLYNFLYRGTVYNYQSGFRYSSDAMLKPGLVVHALTVAHNATAGAIRYDLLAGDQQYKRSLATATRPMYWVIAQRPRLRFRIENALLAVVQTLRQKRGG